MLRMRSYLTRPQPNWGVRRPATFSTSPTTGRMHISVGLIARIRRLAFVAGVLRRPAPPTLPLLEYAGETGAADWLRASLTTFAVRVASFLPGHFDAYVRIYHPFDNDDGSPVAVPTWRELA